MVFFNLDVWILLANRLHAFVPVGHGDGNAVRLGGRCQFLCRTSSGELECISDDPVHAYPCEHSVLDDGLAVRALEYSTAYGAVLALCILPYSHEIDGFTVTIGKR